MSHKIKEPFIINIGQKLQIPLTYEEKQADGVLSSTFYLKS